MEPNRTIRIVSQPNEELLSEKEQAQGRARHGRRPGRVGSGPRFPNPGLGSRLRAGDDGGQARHRRGDEESINGHPTAFQLGTVPER